MYILDPKFKANKHKYLLQCSILATAMLFTLLFLDMVTYPALITSLGATFFTMFIIPNAYASAPRRLIGGYAIGILSGIFFYCLVNNSFVIYFLPITYPHHMILFGTIAVGTAGFIMTLTNMEHPPAVGVALGLVINDWDWLTLCFLAIAVLLSSVIKTLFKPIMIDLIDMN